MNRALSASALALLALSAQVAAARVAAAQAKVPVMALTPASAKSVDNFGAILGLRQLPSGEVLVNDAGRRRLVKLDASLAKGSVVIDSTAGAANSYGPRPAPLIAYLGDSSLFVDAASSSLLVIDPKGSVARVMSAPKPGDLRFLGGSPAYVDDKGRLLYRGAQMVTQRAPSVPGEVRPPVQPPDSAPILRADFDTRTVDTIGRVKITSGMRMAMDRTPDGKMQMKMTINPLQVVDDWAVLSDGTLAFVRGHDYHVDVISPKGDASKGNKLPFDWKRLEDSDKQKLVDSARIAQEAAMKNATTTSNGPGNFTMAAPSGGGSGAAVGGETRVMVMMAPSGGGGGGGAPTMSGGGGDMPMGAPMQMGTPQVDFVPLKEISDYWPAIRPNAAKADLDGNLWILPTTSAQSVKGELVYDVVNKSGELFQRVRMPEGRSLVGFGKGGVVYLVSGDRTSGFTLERTSIVGGFRAATN